ncbi:MAG TPA: NUDIX domain-containing protein [Chitinophagaceae bacterium]|nr:NUDIX domain-containing protein [Chitinophagaceae bacterium]
MSCITIYFEDKPVYLCDELNPEIYEVRHHPDAVFIDELSTSAINSLLHEIKKPAFHAGIIFHQDFINLKKSFFKHFKFIQTGGGLVKNKSGEILLIFRRGKWDLPKGKIDEGETLEECAIREVQEETGIQKLKIVSKINITYHTYIEFGKHILKESHWYLMNAMEQEEFIPQVEEDITEINWVKKEDLKKYITNTFPTIVSVLQNVEKI